MKRIVAILTYLDTPYQIMRTLQSIADQDYHNIHVVVVDDGSDEPFNFRHNDLNTHTIRIKKEDKVGFSPVIALNKGIERALHIGADAIILQNGECMHVGEVLRYVNKNLTEENYISFACFSVDEKYSNDLELPKNIHTVIDEHKHDAGGGGEIGWYNHAEYRDNAYNWCCAITPANIRKLNGFDERFAYGVGYADDDFVARIRRIGLRIEIPSNPFVVHQWHKPSPKHPAAEDPNHRLWYDRIMPSVNVKAEHIYTKEL
jgi:GT2 family glycosyltransferase